VIVPAFYTRILLRPKICATVWILCLRPHSFVPPNFRNPFLLWSKLPIQPVVVCRSPRVSGDSSSPTFPNAISHFCNPRRTSLSNVLQNFPSATRPAVTYGRSPHVNWLPRENSTLAHSIPWVLPLTLLHALTSLAFRNDSLPTPSHLHFKVLITPQGTSEYDTAFLNFFLKNPNWTHGPFTQRGTPPHVRIIRNPIILQVQIPFGRMDSEVGAPHHYPQPKAILKPNEIRIN